MTTPPVPTPHFNRFYKHDELTRLLKDYAQAKPGLMEVESIGKSYQGRDIWVATLTNAATGDAEDKPAFWADGNIHAAELTASTARCCTTCNALRDQATAATPTSRGLLDNPHRCTCARA